MSTIPRPLLAEMREIVGAQHVLQSDDVTAGYRTDWTKRFKVDHATVVRPGTTDEVALVIRACAEFGTAITSQGGNTGLVGGGVPLSGELVLSTQRLSRMEEVAAEAGQLTVGAGTRLVDVQAAAIAAGWEYGVDIASRDTATIGGTIATNAGGLRVIRYGDTRQQLLGIEVVAGDGEIVTSMAAAERTNTGYHLPSMLAGSEGTLGVVTKALLRLQPRLPARTVALLRFEAPMDAVRAAEGMRRCAPSVSAVEVFFSAGLELVCRVFNLPPPFLHLGGGYVLVEMVGNDDMTTELGAVIESLPGVADVAIGEDARRQARLWRYRELHTSAISTVGVPHKLDIAVPRGGLADFIEEVPHVVAAIAPGAATWLFGHGGESSVHVNVTGPSPDDHTVDDAVLRLVARMGGSISAEHGVGRAKLPWIRLNRSEPELRLLARVKAAFDPAGIMNPAVLFPAVASTS